MGWLYFVLAIGAAFVFYWLRSKHRIAYGLFEIAVGIAILAVRFVIAGPAFLLVDDSGSEWFGRLTALISLFTGIYAIVRGLDNIVTTLRDPHALR